MKTLFHAELSDREFASHLLHVPDLLEWAKSKRLHIQSTPPLEGFEFVQVEALLCAIERNIYEVTPAQAFDIVASNPALRNDRAAGDPSNARWLLGADAHMKWRAIFARAIADRELVLLDFGSKTPIEASPKASPAATAHDWKDTAREYATKVWNNRPKNTNPGKEAIAESVRKMLDAENIMGPRGPLSKDNILREALNTWSKPGKPGIPK